MAETFTYENAPNTEVLTEEEQDSLAVGEKMMAEQEGLLAGKYKNAQELEKAYMELQSKLGSGEEAEPAEEQEQEQEPEVSPAQALITEASTQYAETGEVSEEMMAQFSEMDSQDLVQAYMAMQANAPQAQETVELSDRQVNNIKNSVGGEEAYGEVMSWAGQNLSQDQIDAFDNIIATGNEHTIQMMVNGLKAQYEAANGYEGRMLSGKASDKGSSDVFRSQAELVNAMSDPRYDNDPAYRMDVLEKLDRSDINF